MIGLKIHCSGRKWIEKGKIHNDHMWMQFDMNACDLSRCFSYVASVWNILHAFFSIRSSFLPMCPVLCLCRTVDISPIYRSLSILLKHTGNNSTAHLSLSVCFQTATGKLHPKKTKQSTHFPNALIPLSLKIECCNINCFSIFNDDFQVVVFDTLILDHLQWIISKKNIAARCQLHSGFSNVVKTMILCLFRYNVQKKQWVRLIHHLIVMRALVAFKQKC